MLSNPVNSMLNHLLIPIFASFVVKTMKIEEALEERHDEIGNDHIGSAEDTPLRKDAFVLEDDEKIHRIEKNVREIMLTLGLDLDDDSLSGTPKRVAKMFVKELFGGLHPKGKPKASTFDNKYKCYHFGALYTKITIWYYIF